MQLHIRHGSFEEDDRDFAVSLIDQAKKIYMRSRNNAGGVVESRVRRILKMLS